MWEPYDHDALNDMFLLSIVQRPGEKITWPAKPEALFRNYFSSMIQIWWKFNFAHIKIIIPGLLQVFTHDTKAVLLCHMQTFVMIWFGSMEYMNIYRIWIMHLKKDEMGLSSKRPSPCRQCMLKPQDWQGVSDVTPV